MEQFFDSLVPILGILCAVALPIAGGIFLATKNIVNKHNEKMKMIEAGLIPQELPKEVSKTATLRNGMLMLGLGIGAILGFFLGEWLGYEKLTFALMVCLSALTLGGLALCLCYVFLYRSNKDENTDIDE